MQIERESPSAGSAPFALGSQGTTEPTAPVSLQGSQLNLTTAFVELPVQVPPGQLTMLWVAACGPIAQTIRQMSPSGKLGEEKEPVG